MMNVMAVYLAYPRHREPRVAVRAIERAITRICKGESGSLLLPQQAYAYLMQRTKLYAGSPAGRNVTPTADYRPYPASWFNASSYLEDEAEWQRGVRRTGPDDGIRNTDTEPMAPEVVAALRKKLGVKSIPL